MFSTDLICLQVQARSLLFDVQHLVKKKVKFVPAFFNTFNKPTEEVLRDSPRGLYSDISLLLSWNLEDFVFCGRLSTGKGISYSRTPLT